ncbi:MAG: hypothetical protein E7561_01895 [Ruminococcaceae bacterium]|nr:hypothetical protein [Oscillospiraceae bacterium]
MSVFSFLAVCVAAFLFGMLVGVMGNTAKNTVSPIKFKNHREDISSLAMTNREYRNFLNYDGTEQN